MAITSRVTLKASYETGDKPDGSDYVNWLDSFVHLTDTSSQAISSPMVFNATANFQTLTATDIAVSGVGAALVETGILHVSAASGGAYFIDTLKVSASSVFNTVSANSLWASSAVLTDVSAGTINVDNLIAVSAVISSGTFVNVSAETINVDNLIAVSAVIGSANFTDAFILNGMRVRVTAAIPTAGQHAQGDVAFNSGPAAGGTVGWVNVVAGAPGTWKEFGVIEA